MVEQTDVAIHVRYEGRSYEFAGGDLDLGELSTDDDVLTRVAGELGAENLNGFVVDREGLAFTVRPQAVFGD